MSQTSIGRCTLGAALLSSVVGGLSYGSAKAAGDRKEVAFRELAEDECMANDPFDRPDEDTIGRIRRLQALHRVCHYSLTGEIEP
jgi:hypothetical protein